MCFQFHPFQITEEEVEAADQAAIDFEDISDEEIFGDSLSTYEIHMATRGLNGLNIALGLMGEEEVLVENWIQLNPNEKMEVFDTILKLDLVHEVGMKIKSEEAMAHIRGIVTERRDGSLELA